MANSSTKPPCPTIGLDLGDRVSHACVLDAQGHVLERFRVRSTRPELSARFAGRVRARIVMEVGTRSPWISRLLEGLGHEVIVANARKLPRNPCKTDVHDAEFLARLGRAEVGLLHPIRHRSAARQAHLAVIRARDMAVRARTKLINCVRGTAKSWGYEIASCVPEHFAQRALGALPPELGPALKPLVRLVTRVNEEVADYDAEIERLGREVYPESGVLRQVPGVGAITALTYVLVLDHPDRVRSSRSVGAYLGLVPRTSQSGERDPQLRISKSGDALLRRLLVMSAQSLLRATAPDTDLKRFGTQLGRIGGRAGRKRAVVAVARRLSVLLHRLWKTAEVYEPLHQAQHASGAA